MGEIIRRNWDLTEFRVGGNWPSPIQQVQVPIRRAITLRRGLLNPIWQVVFQIYHGCWYPPYCSHLHPPSLSFSSTMLPSSQEHKVKSSLSISPCHHCEFTLSAEYTKYSIHRVQHTPGTAYTEYSIHQVQHTLSKEYTEYSKPQVKHTPRIACRPFILKISSWLLNVASASAMPPCRSTATSLFSIWVSKVKSPRDIPLVSS